MHNLLKSPKLSLLYANRKTVAHDTFDDSIGDWVVIGDWHKVTVDSNVDLSAGLAGGVAINCFGSYHAGKAEKKVTLKNYGELSFEHYVQNDNLEIENTLRVYVDEVLKLDLKGPSPWRRSLPIGLTPGEHTIKLIYAPNGEPNGKKGVIDNVIIKESENVNGLIMSQTPPRPTGSRASNKTLRGFTTYQEMSSMDTECKFTIGLNGVQYKEFVANNRSIFYYIDEFGTCHRGILADNGLAPKSIALQTVYTVDCTLVCANEAGTGFC